MHSKSNELKEGMRAGDLHDLVLPLISVDEYESTVDPSAVSIGFYVHDEDAANDLNRFLQKSSIALLSSEVSPAPDQHGYFIVFVELMLNDRIAENMKLILEELEPLCEIEKWKMRVRKTDELVLFSPEKFAELLAHARHSDKQDKNNEEQTKNEGVLEFLFPSVLKNAIFEQGELFLESQRGMTASYKVIDFGNFDEIMVRKHLTEKSIGLELQQIARCNRIIGMLGEGWTVNEVDGYTIVQHFLSDQCLILS